MQSSHIIFQLLNKNIQSWGWDSTTLKCGFLFWDDLFSSSLQFITLYIMGIEPLTSPKRTFLMILIVLDMPDVSWLSNRLENTGTVEIPRPSLKLLQKFRQITFCTHASVFSSVKQENNTIYNTGLSSNFRGEMFTSRTFYWTIH